MLITCWDNFGGVKSKVYYWNWFLSAFYQWPLECWPDSSHSATTPLLPLKKSWGPQGHWGNRSFMLVPCIPCVTLLLPCWTLPTNTWGEMIRADQGLPTTGQPQPVQRARWTTVRTSFFAGNRVSSGVCRLGESLMREVHLSSKNPLAPH
jgi:hypothetical protein